MSANEAGKSGKNKGGRPPIVLTEEQVAQVEALGAVLSLEQIADYFGIGRNTLTDIMKRQPEVAERYKKGKSRAIASVATGLLQRAQAGDTASAIFYLKTQARWRETQAIEHTSPDGSMSPTRIEIVAPSLKNDDAKG